METTSSSYLDIAKSLPITNGDILFIASDLKKIALKCRANNEQFNVNDFIKSFQDVLKNGTIVIPAYTDNLKSGDTFDHKKSKPTTGALSNKIFKHSDFTRSIDPLHSVFSWGKESNNINKLDNDSTFGSGSIFDYLYLKKAKMICVDVDFQNSFTFVHYIEEKMKVHYRKYYTLDIKTLINEAHNVKRLKFHTKKPLIETKLDDLESAYKKQFSSLVFHHKDVEIVYFDLNDMYRFTENHINSGKKLFRYNFKIYFKNIARKILNQFKRT